MLSRVIGRIARPVSRVQNALQSRNFSALTRPACRTRHAGSAAPSTLHVPSVSGRALSGTTVDKDSIPEAEIISETKSESKPSPADEEAMNELDDDAEFGAIEEEVRENARKAKEAAEMNRFESHETTKGEAKSHTFQAETRQILDIVANSLYTDKEVFLRELISNASDALEKARYFQQMQNKELVDPERDLEIHINLDEAKKTLTVQDFGVGMTGEELVSHLGTIARSGSKAFVKDVTDKLNDSSGTLSAADTQNIIGQFGVGFYSCFMVGTHVDVYSKPAVVEDGTTDTTAHFWTSDGSGSYKLQEAEGAVRGTKIVVHLKDDALDFSKKHLVEGVIKKYSNFVGFPIFINGERVNTINAIWTQSANEVDDAEHLSFYRYIANAYDTPVYRLHFQTDVPIQIHALFYFPERHMEKYGMGRMDPGVSLYSRKVLIQSKTKSLMPEWARFVQGVVDSEDIPLNISRENMQDSALISKIGSVLTKKLIRFIDQQSKKDAATYHKWFTEFGNFLKEGVCTDYNNKDNIAKLLRFESSVTVEESDPDRQMTSLDEYVSRMPVEQKNIYYLTAPSRSFAKSSPYYENFESKGIEVLFLYQHIDDFVMKNLAAFNKRNLVSVESAEVEDLAKISSSDASKSGEEEDKGKDAKEGDTAKKTPSSSNDNLPALNKDDEVELCMWLKTTLSSTVNSVTVSERLVNTPAIVVDHESAAMRRMMKYVNQGQGDQPLPKQKLEINTKHPILKQLFALKDSQPKVAKLVAQQIFDNALISADILDNPRTMLTRLNSLLEGYVSQAVALGPGEENSASAVDAGADKPQEEEKKEKEKTKEKESK